MGSRNGPFFAAPQHAVADKAPYTRLNNDYKLQGGGIMIINGTYDIPIVLMLFVGLGAILIAGLLAWMHLRHRYHPNLIGALIGALFCFLLLEALPAIT
ncbi:hypothetical protein [Paraburkholderia tropica]|uniref:hypothetical protein n=2 Tax=Paraburkholderia tropica TaxID=92647 RepID=UPI0038BC818D